MDNQQLLNALKNGNIPKESILDFTVGREKELDEFKNILKQIEKGNSITKFINGEFGAGKSFFLKLIEETAYNNNFVVSKITISQNLQFQKIDDIYREIAKTLKCKTGDTLNHIIERWIDGVKSDVMYEYGEDEESEKIKEYQYDKIKEELIATRDCSNSFATAIEKVYLFKEENNDTVANNAQAWLRGDSNIPFSEKRKFGVKGDITKENTFHFLTALSTFIKSIGYSGLVILIDEIEFVLKLPRQKSRDVTYNYIRDIFDDCNNGTFSSMLFVFAGTPEFFEDPNKGVKSYDALYSRIVNVLETNYDDLRTPIINIYGFDKKDIEHISKKIINLHKETYHWDTSIVEEVLDEFIQIHMDNSGLTGGIIVPRKYIRDLVSVLDTVEQNQKELNNKEEILKIFTQEEENISEEDDLYDDW